MTDLRDALVALEKELRIDRELKDATDEGWDAAEKRIADKLAALLASHPSPDVEAMVDNKVAMTALAAYHGNGGAYSLWTADQIEAMRAALHAIGLPGMVANDARYRWLRDEPPNG